MSQLVGLGRLVHDAHWRRTVDDVQYLGSRGGGSVWNILANAADHGISCRGIGVSGHDARSEIAIADNLALGLDMNWIESFDGRVTSSMHHFARAGVGPLVKYQTSSMCQRCHNRPQGPTIGASKRISAGPRDYGMSTAVFVADQLSQVTSAWAGDLRADGWTTAIDIGYPGYLRFTPRIELDALLRPFDFIIVQASVGHFLEQKLGGTMAQLAAHLRSALMVSDGESGMSAWDARNASLVEFTVPAPICEVRDTVGAGDALMGGILAELIISASGSSVRTVSSREFEIACQAAMERVPGVLGELGARGHLKGGLSVLPASDEDDRGAQCTICGAVQTPTVGSVSRPRAPRVGASLAERNLARRRRVLEAIAQPGSAVEAIEQLVNSPKNTVVTGTGGSFAAASSIARVLNHVWGQVGVSHRPLAMALRPMDVIRAGGGFDRVVGISYSGGTDDVRQSIVLGASAGAETWLITGGMAPLSMTRRSGPTRIVGYGYSEGGSQRSRESGFVSFVGAASPLVLLLSAVCSIDLVREVIRDSELTGEAEEAVTILGEHFGPRGEGGLAVIGSGWCEPAMLDLESKFVEGGLAPITLHDSKDFSHGRFQSLSLEPVLAQAVLTLRVGAKTHYEQLLERVLRQEVGDDRVVELAARAPDALGMLESLLAVQNFAVKIGTGRSLDISKPKRVGKSWLQLYRWNRSLLSSGDYRPEDDDGEAEEPLLF